MDLKDFYQSTILKKILYGFGILVVALVVFQAGMFVGFKKAEFSFNWGDNYYRAFGEHGKDKFPRDDFANPHGIAGKIIKINLPTVVTEDIDKVEKVMLITDETTIMSFRDKIKSSDLKTGDFIVVLGDPNDKSQIEAKLIRVMPPPPEVQNPPMTQPSPAPRTQLPPPQPTK